MFDIFISSVWPRQKSSPQSLYGHEGKNDPQIVATDKISSPAESRPLRSRLAFKHVAPSKEREAVYEENVPHVQ